jgi:WD40 repeat protein
LLPDWNSPAQECCGQWTPDGKYFLFSSGRGGNSNIWALREKQRFLRVHPEPVQLTTGPTELYQGVLSRDGKRLFVFGNRPQIEMVRYDAKSRQFLPYLHGAEAWSLGVSRDGKWIAYDSAVSVLWRSRMDGSARLQLSSPPEAPVDPHWSPDGKQIAFWTTLLGKPAKMRTVSIEGGPSREVAPEWAGAARPDWSPGGGSLVFEVFESPVPASRPDALYVVDSKTNQVSKLPGSEGLAEPRWSPDGRTIAARTDDQHKLMLFDFESRHWTAAATGTLLSGLNWSQDGKDLYYQDLLESGQPVYRLRLADCRRERVTGCESLLGAGAFRCALKALDSDNSPVLQLMRRFTDIYALDLDLP